MENFLNGLTQSESAALRLCAFKEELSDITLLAQRASRTKAPQGTNQVSVLQTELDEKKKEIAELRANSEGSYPSRQNFGSKRKPGTCRFCNKSGHWWRECRKRANEKPNWVPKNWVPKQNKKEADDKKN